MKYLKFTVLAFAATLATQSSASVGVQDTNLSLSAEKQELAVTYYDKLSEAMESGDGQLFDQLLIDAQSLGITPYQIAQVSADADPNRNSRNDKVNKTYTISIGQICNGVSIAMSLAGWNAF